MKILLVGVNPDSSERVTLAIHLRWPDATILVADTSDEAMVPLNEQSPDLVFVQASDDRRSVVEAIHNIRAASNVPLMVLDSRGTVNETEEVRALEAGADDYLKSTPAIIEIVARVVALMRRAWNGSYAQPSSLIGGSELLLNPATYDVFVDGKPLRLTKTEFRLLHTLMAHEGTVLTHRFLETVLWSGDVDGSALVKKYVQRLRHKLGDRADQPRWIISVHGIGYQFVGANGKGAREAVNGNGNGAGMHDVANTVPAAV